MAEAIIELIEQHLELIADSEPLSYHGMLETIGRLSEVIDGLLLHLEEISQESMDAYVDTGFMDEVRNLVDHVHKVYEV